MNGTGKTCRHLAAFVVTLTVTSACAEDGAALRYHDALPIDIGAVSTLYVDSAGSAWVGGAGGIAIVARDGTVTPAMGTRGTEAPRVVGETAGSVHVLHLDSLIAIDRATRERTGSRGGFEAVPVAVDRRGRFVAQGARSGAVLAFDPRTVEPLWGWGARAAVTTALVESPSGDVLWQALGDEDPVILRRDVQTGRVLARHEFGDPVLALAVTRSGDLLILSGAGERLELSRQRPVADDLVAVWSTAVSLDGEGRPEIIHRPGAPLVATFRPGGGDGVRATDAESGEPVGSTTDPPLDVAMSPDGTIHLLFSDAIRRVRRDGGRNAGRR